VGVASALLQIIGNFGAAHSGNTREPLVEADGWHCAFD
jgi:hypothetical protein